MIPRSHGFRKEIFRRDSHYMCIGAICSNPICLRSRFPYLIMLHLKFTETDQLIFELSIFENVNGRRMMTDANGQRSLPIL